ncbi:ketopantoate reductase [Persicimonas caeni]|uniref:Ketopantoate reductase n=1 Tax=Persicimonas caeni TaxID=2292766 RepID=A0A4Y6PW43_PERCE|nr:2-dehydropantoate 2-reductase N-terminal domain-containing protein [Persicimonas caeni]QDG52339.1 ketopantoate reductase [Persicimonas caeni]QED33561.1 ketopantoate reductase [Persicimonas caeni]
MTESSNERILMVGAGAVGQAYGYHLHQGGADVAFLVKEKYREETEAGFVLHRHRMFRRPDTFGFADFDVYTDYDEVEKVEWDQVWLCMSSTALRGEWLEDLCGRLGDATLVSLQPGIADVHRVEEVYDPTKVVFGLITLIAYGAPLPGEALPEGVAYFLPPLTPIPFSGRPERAARVAHALARGGCRATVDPKTPQLAAFGAATMNPAIAGLEVAGWSLERFRKTPALEIATAAAKEALQVVGMYHFAKVPLSARTLRRPEILGPGLALAPPLMPFDLEVYLEYHFTKVGDQTRQILADYIALGEAQGNPTRALRVLRRLLEPSEE